MTVAQLRADPYAHCAYILFVEGLKYAWTTDESGDLWGAGAGSWIYRSEHPHEVKPGLRFPNWTLGLDPVSGMLRTNSARFQILDTDGTLATLFATEAQTRSILLERIGPNDTVTSVLTSEGAAQDLSGKAIGLETIGPTGTRRRYFPMPVAVDGLEHAVHWHDPDVMAPVVITDEPEQFAGRMVTLYRVYKDKTLTNGNYLDWPAWTTQHNGGGVAWFGRLKDSGTVSPDKVWSLQCSGPESLLKKTLNAHTTNDWFSVSAAFAYNTTAGERTDQIAVEYGARSALDPAHNKFFQSSIFDEGVTDLTAVDRQGIATEIDTLMAAVTNGTSTNKTFPVDGGHLEDYANGACTMGWGSKVAIYRSEIGVGTSPTKVVCWLTLHESVWRMLGYEPETQSYLGNDDIRRVSFRKWTAGEDYYGFSIPAEGYWRGEFSTSKLGSEQPAEEGNYEWWDNNGAWRYYWPWISAGISVLKKTGDQEISISGADHAYIEPQLAWPSKEVDVDGTAVGYNATRYFVFKGKIYRGGDEEPKDMWQVARCSLRLNGSKYGTIHPDTNTGIPVIYLEEWMDPMAWGLNYEPLESDWAGANDKGEAQIWAKPIAKFGFMPRNWADYAHLVLLQILLSTGTSTGWTDYADAATPPSLDRGDNSHGALGGALWGDDLEIADLGLAISKELVAEPLDIAAAFSDVTGTGWNANLCRGRWIADGPVQAWDLLRSITETRRLAWTLHGAKFGLIKFQAPAQADVDVAITEDDLNTAAGPGTRLRVSGYVDKINLGYRYSAEGEGLAEEFVGHARDPNARGRVGDTVVRLKDGGALAGKWFLDRADGKSMEVVAGAGDWASEFRHLWEVETATQMSKRHFVASGVVVKRIKGQDIWPGTRIRLTNPWIYNPDGTYGITALPAIVLKVSVNTKAETYTIDAMVFDDAAAGMRHFAPIGRVRRIDESGGNDVIYLYDDWLGHGDTDLTDCEHFAAPAWDSLGGNAIIRLWHYNRNTWEAGQTATVGSVDTAANTITCSGNLSGSYEERDKETLVTMETYDNQTAAWVKGHFGCVVLPNLKHGATPTAGRPYH